MSIFLSGEMLVAGSIGFLGAACLRIGMPRLRRSPTVLFSGLVGVLLVALTTVMSLVVGQPNSLWIQTAVAGLLGVLFLRREGRESRLKEGAITVAVAGLVAALVTIALGLLVAPTLTFDSWRFLEYGRSAFGDGLSIGELLTVFANYPIVLTSIEGLAARLGTPFASSSVAAFGVLAVAGSVDAFTRNRHGTDQMWKASAIVAIVIAMGASAYVTRVQLGYVNSHALVAGYYAMAMTAIFVPDRGSAPDVGFTGQVRTALLGVSCCGIALARVEGLLIVALLLAAALAHRTFSRMELLSLTLAAVVIPGIWYGRLIAAGVTGAILSPARMTFLLGAAAIPMVVSLAKRRETPAFWASAVALSSLASAALLLALVRPEEFGASVGALGLNLVVAGLWGATWWVVIPLAVLALLRLDDDQPLSSWLLVTFGFVLLVLLLGGVRDAPYRAGWGDSGNRMMVHVLPAFLLLIQCGLGPGHSPPDSQSRRRKTRHGTPAAME